MNNSAKHMKAREHVFKSVGSKIWDTKLSYFEVTPPKRSTLRVDELVRSCEDLMGQKRMIMRFAKPCSPYGDGFVEPNPFVLPGIKEGGSNV